MKIFWILFLASSQNWTIFIGVVSMHSRGFSYGQGTDWVGGWAAGRPNGRTDVRQILNIGPVYKGPIIRGQVSGITGQFSSELAR